MMMYVISDILLYSTASNDSVNRDLKPECARSLIWGFAFHDFSEGNIFSMSRLYYFTASIYLIRLIL